MDDSLWSSGSEAPQLALRAPLAPSALLPEAAWRPHPFRLVEDLEFLPAQASSSTGAEAGLRTGDLCDQGLSTSFPLMALPAVACSQGFAAFPGSAGTEFSFCPGGGGV